MSDAELNNYRFTSLDEPTEEMLSALMKEVAEEAVTKSKNAHKKLFDEIKRLSKKVSQ